MFDKDWLERMIRSNQATRPKYIEIIISGNVPMHNALLKYAAENMQPVDETAQWIVRRQLQKRGFELPEMELIQDKRYAGYHMVVALNFGFRVQWEEYSVLRELEEMTKWPFQRIAGDLLAEGLNELIGYRSLFSNEALRDVDKALATKGDSNEGN